MITVEDRHSSEFEPIDQKKLKIFVTDRNYSEWIFLDAVTNHQVSIEEYPILKQINPLDYKIFGRDIFMVSINLDDTPKINIIHSYVKTCTNLAGVLILEKNKTYGRTANKKRLLYKCIPDDAHLPAFLIPYDITMGFSKVQKNKYIVFQYSNWDNKHPHGVITETLGCVDSLDVFYEYQLYCKSLHISLTDFTDSTRDALNRNSTTEYVDQILKNPAFKIEDRRDKYVFTIDPKNSMDYDDGFGIEEFIDTNGKVLQKVTIYIANVFVWLETLGLWNSFSRRVATIYLPDRRRPMLPTILSDTLCSLQKNQPRFAFAMDFYIDDEGAIVDDIPISYNNVLIQVSQNYGYEDPKMIKTDKKYAKLLEVSSKMDRSVKNSHDLVAHWMVCMNSQTGLFMADEGIGIFRSAMFVNSVSRVDISPTLNEETARVIRSWNNTMGQYILYDPTAVLEHEMMNMRYFRKEPHGANKHLLHSTDAPPLSNQRVMKSYIHITSPIRRLVDLLNQMMLFQNRSLVTHMSEGALGFLKRWTDQMDYINTAMRSIRKIQTDCEVLNRCFANPEIMDREHSGVVFDKITKNDGTISYMVYLEEFKILSRITTTVDVPNYSYNQFKLFLFEDEEKVKKKIRLQII